jgi:hypothetical protein
MATEIVNGGTNTSFQRSCSVPLLGAAILLALKLSVLGLFGPTFLPDSSTYIDYADQILTGAFLHVDLSTFAIPDTLVRPIGLPAIIAAAKIIAGADWAWLVVLFQFAMSMWATIMVYRLARMFRLGLWSSLGVAAAQATALQFVLDQAILSDSLCGSVVTIAVCILSGAVLRGRPKSLARFLSAGLLLAAGMLLRTVTEYMAIGLIPLVTAAAMVEKSRLQRSLAFGLVFLPLMVTHFAYAEWNRWRVGAAFVTTASQNVLFGSLIEAARYDPSIFSGTSPIDDAGRRAFKTLLAGQGGYETEADVILHRDYGWDAVRMSREVSRKYLLTWWLHPVAMLRRAVEPLSEQQVHQAVRLTETVRDVLLWNTGSDHHFARDQQVRDGNLWMIPAVVAHRLIETLSVAIFSAFILITPFRLVREGVTAETSVSASLLCFYLVTAGLITAVVVLQPRYLAPVVPASIVIGAANLAWVISRYRRRSAVNSAGQVPDAKPPWTIP